MIRPLTPEEALKHTGELIRNIGWPEDWRGVASLCSVNKTSVYVKYIRPPFSGGGLLVSLEDFARDWKFELIPNDLPCGVEMPDPKPKYRPYDAAEAFAWRGRKVRAVQGWCQGQVLILTGSCIRTVILHNEEKRRDAFFLYSRFLEDFVWADNGATCGVKLEEQ